MSVGDALTLHRNHSVLDFVSDNPSWEFLGFSFRSRTSVVIENIVIQSDLLLCETLLFICLTAIALHIPPRFDTTDRQCQCVCGTDDGRPRTPRQERERKRQRRCQAQRHQSRKRTLNMILPVAVLGILFLICFWLLADPWGRRQAMLKRPSGGFELPHNAWALQESGGSAAFWANLCRYLLIWLRVFDLSQWDKFLTTTRAFEALTRIIGGNPLTPNNGELSLSGVAGNSTGFAQLAVAKFGVADAPLTLFTNVASTLSIALELWYFPRALKKYIEVASRACPLELKKMVSVLAFGVGSFLIWLSTTTTSALLGTSQTASINGSTSGTPT